ARFALFPVRGFNGGRARMFHVKRSAAGSVEVVVVVGRVIAIANQKRGDGKTIYQALVAGLPIAEILRQVRPLLSLAPAGDDLVGAEIELVTMEGRERRLRALLEPVRHEYNYVLIDTPPSLGILTLNALVAADSVLVPMQCEYYALEGLSALLGTINKVKAALRPGLEIEGLVLTMFDTRNRLSHEIS